MVKRVMGIGMTVVMCCAFCMLASADAEAVTLSVSSYRTLNDGQTEVVFAWSPLSVTLDGGYMWQGQIVPTVYNVSPNIVHIVETTSSGQINYLLVENRGTATLTRPTVQGCTYAVLYEGYHPYTGRHWTDGSNTVSVGKPVPSVPTVSAPAATILAKRQFYLNWTDSSNAFIYQVQQSTSSGFGANVKEYWPTPSQEPITLYTGGTYYFRVRAWNALPQNGGVASGWSNTVSTSVRTTIDAPTINSTGAITAGQAFTVSWNAISEAVMYQVALDTTSTFGSANQKEFWPSGTYEPLAGLAAGTYYLRVKAWGNYPSDDGIVSSGWSPVVTVVVSGFSAPVINAASSAFSGQTIPVTWGAISGAAMYQIQFDIQSDFASENKKEFWPQGEGAVSEQIPGQTAGMYYVRMRAWNADPDDGGVASAWSSTVTIAVSDLSAPVFIAPITSIVAGQSLPVTWSTVTGAAMYQMLVDTTSAFGSDDQRQFWPQAAGDTVTNLKRGTYYLKVRAWSAAPEYGGVASAWSSTITLIVTSQIETPVIAPVASVYAGQSMSVTWNAVADAGIYQVLIDTTDTFGSVSQKEFWPSGTFETISGLSAGTYYVRVRAWTALPADAGISSEWSPVVKGVVSAFNAPVITPVSTVVVGQSIPVSWSAVSGATMYQVQFDTRNDFTSANNKEFWPQGTSEPIAGQTVAGTYYARVRAWTADPNAGGVSSSWSSTVAITVTDLSVPAIHPIGSVLAGQSLPVTWSAVSGATMYQLLMDTTDAFGSVNERQFWPQAAGDSVAEIPAGTYYFKVRAWTADPNNGGVSSAWSSTETVTIVTLGQPQIVAPGEVGAGAAFMLIWSPVAQATVYQMQFDTQNDFASATISEYWPEENKQTIPAQSVGTYYVRLRAWTATPESGGVASAWSSTATITVSGFSAPVLNPVDTVITGQSLSVTWNTVPGAYIYQLLVDTTADFGSANERQYWPQAPLDKAVISQSGTYYFKVRAWTALPQDGGVSSVWSETVTAAITVSAVTTPDVPVVGAPSPSVLVEQQFTLDWTDCANATIYQVQQSTSSDFAAVAKEYWPTGSLEPIILYESGTYYFRIRSWNQLPADGGVASAWSNTVSTVAGETLASPVINPLSTVIAGQTIALSWNAVGGAVMYQIQFDTQSDFASENKKEFWPQGTDAVSEQIPGQIAGTYYVRMRAWNADPADGGVSSEWSSVVTVPVLVIANGPALNASEWSGIVRETVTLDWSDTAGASIYQGVVAADAAFTQEIAQFWPGNSYEVLSLTRPGKLYVRVRAWSAAPEDGGVATAWSAPAIIWATPAAPIMLSDQGGFSGELLTLQWVGDDPVGNIKYTLSVTEDATGTVTGYETQETSLALGSPSAGTYTVTAMAQVTCTDGVVLTSATSEPITLTLMDSARYLALIEKQAFLSLLDATYANGLTRDRYHADRKCSAAALGDETDAISSAATGFYLSALTVGVENKWITRAEGYKRALATLTTMGKVKTYKGFFYHYMQPNGTPSVYPTSEVSSIDTALFIAGALQAGEYFGGTVKTSATALYKKVQWGALFNWYTYQFHMCWEEGKGLGGEYNAYSEAFLLYFLAVASPTDPVPAYSFYNTSRRKGNYGGGDEMIFTFGGQLFTYQYPQTWIDLRVIKDALGTDWWQNTKTAVLADRQFCIDQPDERYSEFFWGLSACDGPPGYRAYGAKPASYSYEDGTIAPYALAASVPYAPEESIAALKYLYSGLSGIAWGYYGLVDGVNEESAWGAKYYLGLDQGEMVLMLENYRSGLVWKTFMKNVYVNRALIRLRFEGFGKPYNVVDGFENDLAWTPETTFGWWDEDGDLVYTRSVEHEMSHGGQKAMRIDYDYHESGAALSRIGAFIDQTNPVKKFTGKKKLILWASGHGKLHVTLRDRDQNEYAFDPVTITGPDSWTYCEFNLTKATGIRKADIENVLFAIEPAGDSVSGTMWFDDIVIE